MSFKPVIANIETTLSGDPALTAWISATFPGKSLTVLKAFKRRQEISVTDLPLVMITAPSRKNAAGPLGGRRYDSTVMLYAGFYFDGSREDSPGLVEEFESLIEDALLLDRRRGGTAVLTQFEDVANDEGASHPVYFSVLQFAVLTERPKP